VRQRDDALLRRLFGGHTECTRVGTVASIHAQVAVWRGVKVRVIAALSQPDAAGITAGRRVS
jgi:hypothetical protein